MTGAIDGAKKLGLSFTDSTGKMLSMPEMLIKLQGKYGKSLEGNLKAQAELDAAFGDSSAVVKQLYGNVALLQRNITELGGADGLKRTQEMAQKMVKPWDRFVQIPICFCAGLRGTWSDRSPQKTVFSVCSFVNW